VEQRAEPFIAAAPREPVKPAASDAPAPGFRFEPSNAPERPAVRPRTFTPPQDRRTAVDEGRAVDWKRPAAVAAALIVAAGLFGAWQGSRAGGDAETEQPKPAVTVALPRATLAAEAIAPPAPPVAAAAEAPAVRRTRAFSARPIERTAANPAAAEPAAPDPPAQAVADSSEQAAAETAPAPAAAAVVSTMPLSNAVIARTIGSIGYACGRVTSTTAT
ncbi:MAG: hypothetical protein QOF34_102, partial [Sphingomonadales bacterium]|nr:hypothetical protein [Sphingomonadales bacterium]